MNRYSVAEAGLLIRHLILPNDLAGSEAILRFIAEEISRDSYVNLMDQYRPAFKATRIPELARRISSREYQRVIRLAEKLGLHRGFKNENPVLARQQFYLSCRAQQTSCS